jgi:hypothetical protein
MTPGVPASGDRSVVAALPWFVVTGVTLVTLIGAVVEAARRGSRRRSSCRSALSGSRWIAI